MITYPTIPDTITYAKICQYLASNDIEKQRALNWGTIDETIDEKLYTERKSLEWIYNTNPSDPNITSYAHYVYSFCGKYLGQAMIIAGNGSGTIVNPATGAVSTIAYVQTQFMVGQSGSLMNEGDTQFTLNYNYINSGSVSIIYGGVELPLTSTYTTDQQSYSVLYQAGSSIVTFGYPVKNGDLIIVNATHLVAI